MGTTKTGEYSASFQKFVDIFNTQGAILALYFLYDLGYTREDINQMIKVAEQEAKTFGTDVKKYTGLFSCHIG